MDRRKVRRVLRRSIEQQPHNSVSLGRIAFAGTPDFAVPCLAALLAADARVPVVFTQPDRPAGRGRKSTASAVKGYAVQHGCTVCQPTRLNDPDLLAEFAQPDLLVVVAYGLILPKWMLAWPRHGAVNVHASVLPRWRGAAPIQRAILAGDVVTGVTIMQMDTGLDTGPIYRVDETPIGPRENAAQLHDRLAALGARALLASIPAILAGTAETSPQREAQATYADKIVKSEARIDWTNAAIDIVNKVRAFAGWPVAESQLSDGRRIRIHAAEVLASEVPGNVSAVHPGTIVAASPVGIDVASGDGVVRIATLQAPGARAMAVGAWLSAHSVSGCEFVGP